MTVKLGMRVFWNHGPIPVTNRKNARLAMMVPFGTVMNLGGSSSGGGAVNSVNGQGGNVVLTATDVGADIAGSAQAVSDVLQPQITLNTDAVVMLTALLSALQSAKADVAYVNQQIATLVGTDTQTLAAINAISDALSDNEDLLSALDQTVANRVRFDVATQGLTALQKYNARTNIGAEESGTAAQLISQITAASIGAVTASQLANVAFSGSYNDLSNKPSITGALLTGLTSVSAAAISATDSIIGALAKLQANVDTKADATTTLALINAKVSSVLLGVANGVATLGSDGKLTAAQVPASSGSGDVTLVGTGTGLQVGSFLPGMYFDSAGLQPAAAGQVSAFTTGKCFGIVFSQTVRIAQIGFNATSGSGATVVANIAIYSAHPTHGFPYQRVGGAVSVPVTSSGVKMATLDFTFEKNKVYWLRLGSNNGSLSISANTPNYCFGNGESFGFLGPNQAPATMIHGPNNSGQDYPNSTYFIYTSGNGTTEQQPNMLNFIAATAIPKILFRVYS